MRYEIGNKILGLNQGSPEWKHWRNTGIGGSDAPVIAMNGLYGKTPYALWRQKMTGEEAQFTEVQLEHMKRGNDLEPRARAEFIERTGIFVSPVCMQSIRHPFMLASLDGLDKTGSIIVEIKAPAEKMFLTMLKEGTPIYYRWQIQHQLYVTGASECFFWAFNPDIEPHIYFERHTPNPVEIQHLINEETRFYKHVEFGIPPTDEGLGIDKKSLGATGVVMIAGYARAGKDTLAMVLNRMLKATRFGFADKLKSFCMQNGLTKGGEENKPKDRPMLVKVGHGMRRVYGDIWVDGLFSGESAESLAEHASKYGAVIADTRYLNEVVSGKRFAEELGVPFRLLWIERPGVEPVFEEAKCTSLLRTVADAVIINDSDIETKEGFEALEKAAIRALNHSGSERLEVAASQYLSKSKPKARKKNEPKRKTPSRARRG